MIGHFALVLAAGVNPLSNTFNPQNALPDMPVGQLWGVVEYLWGGIVSPVVVLVFVGGMLMQAMAFSQSGSNPQAHERAKAGLRNWAIGAILAALSGDIAAVLLSSGSHLSTSMGVPAMAHHVAFLVRTRGAHLMAALHARLG